MLTALDKFNYIEHKPWLVISFLSNLMITLLYVMSIIFACMIAINHYYQSSKARKPPTKVAGYKATQFQASTAFDVATASAVFSIFAVLIHLIDTIITLRNVRRLSRRNAAAAQQIVATKDGDAVRIESNVKESEVPLL